MEFTTGEFKCKARWSSLNTILIRTFHISKITKCFIFWIETDTMLWNNNHKVFRTKKFFCEDRNCEYFLDNLGHAIYADGIHL